MTEWAKPGVWNAYRDGMVIPGLATVRLPDAEGECRAVRGDRRIQWVRTFAIAANMPTRRFNLLPAVDRAKIRYAYFAMTSPSHCGIEPDPIDWNEFAEAWRNGRVR